MTKNKWITKEVITVQVFPYSLDRKEKTNNDTAQNDTKVQMEENFSCTFNFLLQENILRFSFIFILVLVLLWVHY